MRIIPSHGVTPYERMDQGLRGSPGTGHSNHGVITVSQSCWLLDNYCERQEACSI